MSRWRKLLWVARTIAVMPAYGKIGMPSYIAPTTLVSGARRIFIGRRVRVLPGLFAETHSGGAITIEDNVAIGQGVHITAMGDLTIGAGSTITGYVTITDIDHQYQEVGAPIHAQPLIHSQTTIGKNCFIGMGARVQAGTILGEGCVVGANAVVKGDFAPHSVIVGIPARVVKKFDLPSQSWLNVPRSSDQKEAKNG